MTYDGILAIFPALIALLSVLGLLGDAATQSLLDNAAEVAPRPAQEILTDAIGNLQANQGAAGVLFVVGLGLALWSASGYVAAFMRASNDIYDVQEGRPIWKTLPAGRRVRRRARARAPDRGGPARRAGAVPRASRHPHDEARVTAQRRLRLL